MVPTFYLFAGGFARFASSERLISENGDAVPSRVILVMETCSGKVNAARIIVGPFASLRPSPA
ncbi:MAG: hypothetical protein U0441_14765 [Polyangiaceae bacterium]